MPFPFKSGNMPAPAMSPQQPMATKPAGKFQSVQKEAIKRALKGKK